MCNPALFVAALAGTGAGLLAHQKNKKEADKTEQRINAANQAAQDQVEHNKLANSVQSTEELKNPTLAEQLKQQKVPLNTGSTGTQFSTPTSVGLNLGGY
jgi:hypothetical protein